jgi:DNA-binding transcriptional ArsR family regulator
VRQRPVGEEFANAFRNSAHVNEVYAEVERALWRAAAPVPEPTMILGLTTILVGGTLPAMLDIAVIEDPAIAESLLDPVRTRILGALAEPASATMLASRVGLPRQLVNYHLRTLERHGLVELEAERRKGNVTERVMRASAASYVISPAALTALQPDPGRSTDQRSAIWLLALAARLVRDVGAMLAGATRERRPLSTFALDAEIRFASAADRSAFADELGVAVTSLISRYHDDAAPRGRTHRVLVAIHPSVPTQPSVPTHAPSPAPKEA